MKPAEERIEECQLGPVPPVSEVSHLNPATVM
jgi:hypothetical protein